MTEVVVAVYKTASAAETATADLTVSRQGANGDCQAVCERSCSGRTTSRGSQSGHDVRGQGSGGYREASARQATLFLRA